VTIERDSVEASPAATSPAVDRGPAYRRKLLRLLSVATFFEGYDTFVIALVLPLILADLGGSESQAGVLRGIVGVGEILGFLLAAQADRIGRKRLLLITIAGYTIGTALTAVSPNLVWLTAAQFLAHIFLAGEWAVAVTIVVEDFPADERGRGLGIVTSMNTLGGIFVGVLAFLGLQNTPLDWRAFYLVGILPLILVFIARRGMLETERYTAVQASPAAATLNHTSLWEPWKPQFRRNLVAVGLMHFFRFAAVSSAAFWWPYYAQQEVGMSLSLSGLYLAIAGIVGVGGFIVAGRLMDRWGRRPTFQLYMAATLVFGIWLFQVHSALAMLPLICVGIFFGLGSGAVTSAFSTEFFPTYVRTRAAAWARNAFEIPGGVVGPLLVGVLGDHRTGPIGDIGDAMGVLLVATLIPVLFIAWRYIGETRGADLVAMDEAAV
jgi:MFS transporter, putative metabolite:H+ symporter